MSEPPIDPHRHQAPDTTSGVADLADSVRAGIDELAGSADPDAFRALLDLSSHLGMAIGAAARTLAGSGSWARVAGLAGTTRQAAWQRWSQ